MIQCDEEISIPACDIAARVNDLARTLRELVGQRPVALFGWPNYPNAGDHFIWLGEKVLFKERLNSNVPYECSLHQLDILNVTRLPPETVLVIQGGGNFGDLWDNHQRFKEAIIAAFPDRRILIMPQTVHFLSRERSSAASWRRLPLICVGRPPERYDLSKAPNRRMFRPEPAAIVNADSKTGLSGFPCMA